MACSADLGLRGGARVERERARVGPVVERHPQVVAVSEPIVRVLHMKNDACVRELALSGCGGDARRHEPR